LQYLIVTCFHFSNFEPLETANRSQRQKPVSL